jgi:hypothetical protein
MSASISSADMPSSASSSTAFPLPFLAFPPSPLSAFFLLSPFLSVGAVVENAAAAREEAATSAGARRTARDVVGRTMADANGPRSAAAARVETANMVV